MKPDEVPQPGERKDTLLLNHVMSGCDHEIYISKDVYIPFTLLRISHQVHEILGNNLAPPLWYEWEKHEDELSPKVTYFSEDVMVWLRNKLYTFDERGDISIDFDILFQR